MREYKLPPAIYFPVESPVTVRRPQRHRPHIDPVAWPEVATRARHASLRALAIEYGVSHETVRGIVRRAAMSGRRSTVA